MSAKELFGTESRSEIFDNKHHKKQRRDYTLQSETAKITAEECKELCAAVNLEYQPGYESRVLEYTITNETTDRYGDIVRAEGVTWKNYLNNPVMLFSHSYPDLPVGNTIKIWHDKEAKAVKALGLFFDDRVDPTGRSDTVFRFASSGAMKGCSVGFMPVEVYRPKNTNERSAMGLGEYGVEYRKSDLLEFSPCSIPANPEALRKSFVDKNIKCIESNKDMFGAYIDKIDEWLDDMKKDDTVEIIVKLSEIKEEFRAGAKTISEALNEIKGLLELSVQKIAKANASQPPENPGDGRTVSKAEVRGLYDIFSSKPII